MPSITVDEMKENLLSVSSVIAMLARTEPLEPVDISTRENNIVFELGADLALDAANGSDAVDATVSVDGRELRLTKDALLEATSLCGLRKTYPQKMPSRFSEEPLNYCFKDGPEKSYKLLVTSGDTASAFTTTNTKPFSNLQFLDNVIDGIGERYGQGELFVDPKFNHSLRETQLRLIIPETRRVLTGTGTDDDLWSIGIGIKNSLVGLDQTEIYGYLFRWVCANGAIDTHATSGVWSRKQTGGQSDEVYEWARNSVDGVLGGLESSLDAIQEMVEVPLAGEAKDVLKDVFSYYKITNKKSKSAITDNMVEPDQLSMYAVMQAITQAANDLDLPSNQVEHLMRAGGNLPHVISGRCGECRRFQR